MDWAKAKTILIIALIITDAFLIYNYVTSNKGSGEIDNTEALITVLQESNINVEEIPKEHIDMPALTVHYIEPEQGEVDALISSAGIAVDMGASEADDLADVVRQYTEAAEDFIQYLGMNSQYMRANVIMESSDGDTSASEVQVVFECVRNDYAIDGSYMTCTFKDGALTDFDSHWLEPVEFSRRKLPTISASVALISYMTERETNAPVTVENIEMVYWVDSSSFESNQVVTDTALPVWRLTLSSGEIVHIDAIVI